MLALLPELWLQVEVVSSRWFSPCEKKIKKNKFLLNSKKLFSVGQWGLRVIKGSRATKNPVSILGLAELPWWNRRKQESKDHFDHINIRPTIRAAKAAVMLNKTRHTHRGFPAYKNPPQKKKITTTVYLFMASNTIVTFCNLRSLSQPIIFMYPPKARWEPGKPPSVSEAFSWNTKMFRYFKASKDIPVSFFAFRTSFALPCMWKTLDTNMIFQCSVFVLKGQPPTVSSCWSCSCFDCWCGLPCAADDAYTWLWYCMNLCFCGERYQHTTEVQVYRNATV